MRLGGGPESGPSARQKALQLEPSTARLLCGCPRPETPLLPTAWAFSVVLTEAPQLPLTLQGPHRAQTRLWRCLVPTPQNWAGSRRTHGSA